MIYYRVAAVATFRTVAVAVLLEFANGVRRPHCKAHAAQCIVLQCVFGSCSRRELTVEKKHDAFPAIFMLFRRHFFIVNRSRWA